MLTPPQAVSLSLPSLLIPLLPATSSPPTGPLESDGLRLLCEVSLLYLLVYLPARRQGAYWVRPTIIDPKMIAISSYLHREGDGYRPIQPSQLYDYDV